MILLNRFVGLLRSYGDSSTGLRSITKLEVSTNQSVANSYFVKSMAFVNQLLSVDPNSSNTRVHGYPGCARDAECAKIHGICRFRVSGYPGMLVMQTECANPVQWTMAQRQYAYQDTLI